MRFPALVDDAGRRVGGSRERSGPTVCFVVMQSGPEPAVRIATMQAASEGPGSSPEHLVRSVVEAIRDQAVKNGVQKVDVRYDVDAPGTIVPPFRQVQRQEPQAAQPRDVQDADAATLGSPRRGASGREPVRKPLGLALLLVSVGLSAWALSAIGAPATAVAKVLSFALILAGLVSFAARMMRERARSSEPR